MKNEQTLRSGKRLVAGLVTTLLLSLPGPLMTAKALAGKYATRLVIILSLLTVSFVFPPPAAVMAEPAGVTMQRYCFSWEDQWSTANMTYTDIEPTAGYFPLKATFTPPATADYLLIVSFSVSNANTNTATSVQVLQNATQFYVFNWTPNSTGEWLLAGQADVVSLAGGTSYTFQMQLKTLGTSAALVRNASIILLKITNYYQSSDANTYTYTTATYQDGLSLSIPAAASGDYLVLASNSPVSAISSKFVYCNLLRGSTSQTEIVRMLSRASESRGWLTMRVMTFTGTPETIKYQYKVQAPNTLSVTSQNLTAVKLSDLGIDVNAIESEVASSTTSTSYQTKVTKTFTPSPAQQGDYLVMGFGMLNGSSKQAGNEAYARIDIDGAFQAENIFRPNDGLDYIPVYTFKKYRMTSGSHTVKIEYKSASTSATASVKNARILAIKVNTLQTYEDAAVTIRTLFDSAHNTIFVYGYGFQYNYSPAPGSAMPYKVAYYDGGAAHNGVGGALAYTHSVNSTLVGSIVSSLYFPTVPTASYGTWHAVVYRAYAGDPAPAVTYATNNANSIMENLFTVEQSALGVSPPTIAGVSLFNADRVTAASAVSPQTEFALKVTVGSVNTLASLSTVQTTIFYDADGTYAAGDVPLSGNTQTAAILTCTVGSTPSWSIASGAGSTWSIVTANCIQPSLAGTSGDFWFHFKAGKVATATVGVARWHIYARATNDGGGVDAHQDNRTMNWYGEVTVNTPAVFFGTVMPGSDFGANSKTGISVTYVCNGNYNQQVKVDSPWTGSGYSVSLNAGGTPGEGEFSLKADDTATLGSAVLVSTGYVIVDTGTQTGESGNAENANTLWLKLGASGLPAVTQSGTIFYGIAARI